MNPAVWPRCSFVADAARDRLDGTAPPVEQWFLVEHPGPWDRLGPGGTALGTAARTALSRWTAARGGRALLIRRPASHGHPADRGETDRGEGGRGRVGHGKAGPGKPLPRRWFRVDSRLGSEGVRAGWYEHERDLAHAVADPGTNHLAPLYLTCAHGRHDTCCAVRGRPVAAALAALDPENAWESSHLGGCRFAPTVVLLPHGLVLGRVEPGDAGRILSAAHRGLVVPDLLRGRTCLPPVVQSAQHHARATTGVQGVDALRPLGIEPHGDGGWRVRLAEPDCTVWLAGHRIELGRPLTCAATTGGHQLVFKLQHITVP